MQYKINKILICILILSSYLCKGQRINAYVKFESDTTILADAMLFNKKITIRYYFKYENQYKALEFIKLRTLPFTQLTDKQQDRVIELHPYIRKEEIYERFSSNK